MHGWVHLHKATPPFIVVYHIKCIEVPTEKTSCHDTSISYSMVRACVRRANARALASAFARVHTQEPCYNLLVTCACICTIYSASYRMMNDGYLCQHVTKTIYFFLYEVNNDEIIKCLASKRIEFPILKVS